MAISRRRRAQCKKERQHFLRSSFLNIRLPFLINDYTSDNIFIANLAFWTCWSGCYFRRTQHALSARASPSQFAFKCLAERFPLFPHTCFDLPRLFAMGKLPAKRALLHSTSRRARETAAKLPVHIKDLDVWPLSSIVGLRCRTCWA